MEKAIPLDEEIVHLQPVIDSILSTRESVKVLDAGCGATMHLTMGQHAYIVGIDISETQLQKNEVVDEKIRGDIQTYKLPVEDFDVIVCWWVLEHLSNPEKVLEKFVGALKKEGIIILALPNVLSLKGLATKVTPHWVHMWVQERVFGSYRAKRGARPFRTFLKFSTAPESIKRFALKNGLSVEYFSIYESQWQKTLREKYRIINGVLKAAGPIVKAVTFGKVDPYLTDYIIVLKKR